MSATRSYEPPVGQQQAEALAMEEGEDGWAGAGAPTWMGAGQGQEQDRHDKEHEKGDEEQQQGGHEDEQLGWVGAE